MKWGTKSISDVRYGNNPVIRAYSGDKLVWEKEGPIIIPQPIDLGLASGIKWYPMNIEAKFPYDDGRLYALNEYIQELSTPPPLESTYWDFVDPAVDILIPGRRTPTPEEWEELFACEKELIYDNDVNKYVCRIIGYNGNSLILPLGDYVTNSISQDIISSVIFDIYKTYGQETVSYDTYITYIGDSDGVDDSEKMYKLRAVYEVRNPINYNSFSEAFSNDFKVFKE